MKKLLLILLALAVHAGAIAQSPTQQVVTFRFVPGNDMFYIPWSGNDAELKRLRAQSCRSAYRHSDFPADGGSSVGFRVVFVP